MKSTKGWAIKGGIEFSKEGSTVELCGVCTCSQRRLCESSKRCDMLFRWGGECDIVKKLKRMMGKKFPRSWIDGMGFATPKSWDVRQERMKEFEREYFNKCKSVRIEIHDRDDKNE